MILSRTMRQSDYEALQPELAYLQKVIDVCGWDSRQHTHRRWEYALALKAFVTWKTYVRWLNSPGGCRFEESKIFRIADHGCGIGLLGPMMLTLGCYVQQYEPWVYGDESVQMNLQMERAAFYRKNRKNATGKVSHWGFRPVPLCELTAVDRDFDVSFCISTLEHIGEYQRAFRDLCSSVKPGGMIFLTTDFGEHEEDTYKNANLRAGKMFCRRTYEELISLGMELGFHCLGTPTSDDLVSSTVVNGDVPSAGVQYAQWTDYPFAEEHRLVNDHGFASLCMMKGAV